MQNPWYLTTTKYLGILLQLDERGRGKEAGKAKAKLILTSGVQWVLITAIFRKTRYTSHPPPFLTTTQSCIILHVHHTWEKYAYKEDIEL